MKSQNLLSRAEMKNIVGGFNGCNVSVTCPGGGNKSCSCSEGSCSSSGGTVTCNCALTEEVSVEASLSC